MKTNGKQTETETPSTPDFAAILASFEAKQDQKMGAMLEGLVQRLAPTVENVRETSRQERVSKRSLKSKVKESAPEFLAVPDEFTDEKSGRTYQTITVFKEFSGGGRKRIAGASIENWKRIISAVSEHL